MTIFSKSFQSGLKRLYYWVVIFVAFYALVFLCIHNCILLIKWNENILFCETIVIGNDRQFITTRKAILSNEMNPTKAYQEPMYIQRK